MPYNGSGTFQRTFPSGGWQGDATAGIKIKSDRHDQHDNDLAAGLSNAICKDGQSSPTADIPFNNHRLMQVADPTQPTDAATKKYVDAIKTFSTNLDLSGADANGRINFTSPTGAQGIAWTGADLSWIARLASAAGPGTPPVPPATINRLVLNDKPDGTGTDVVEMRENGTALFTGALTSGGAIRAKTIIQAQADTGNVHFQLLGPADVQRGIIYSPAASVGHLIFTTAAGHTFYMTTAGDFQSPGNVYTGAGAAYLQTNGNVSGGIWDNWGAHDAYSAINARIEARAIAWANDRVASLQYRKVSEGSSGLNADWRAPGGAVVTGYVRDSGNTGQVRYMYYKYLQVYDPVRGWVGFSEA